MNEQGVRPSTLQRVLQIASYSIAAPWAAAEVVDSLSGAFNVVTVQVATTITVAATLLLLLSFIVMRYHPVRWVRGGQAILYTKPGARPIIGLLGIVALCWLPPFCDPQDDATKINAKLEDVQRRLINENDETNRLLTEKNDEVQRRMIEEKESTAPLSELMVELIFDRALAPNELLGSYFWFEVEAEGAEGSKFVLGGIIQTNTLGGRSFIRLVEESWTSEPFYYHGGHRTGVTQSAWLLNVLMSFDTSRPAPISRIGQLADATIEIRISEKLRKRLYEITVVANQWLLLRINRNNFWFQEHVAPSDASHSFFGAPDVVRLTRRSDPGRAVQALLYPLHRYEYKVDSWPMFSNGIIPCGDFTPCSTTKFATTMFRLRTDRTTRHLVNIPACVFIDCPDLLFSSGVDSSRLFATLHRRDLNRVESLSIDLQRLPNRGDQHAMIYFVFTAGQIATPRAGREAIGGGSAASQVAPVERERLSLLLASWYGSEREQDATQLARADHATGAVARRDLPQAVPWISFVIGAVVALQLT